MSKIKNVFYIIIIRSAIFIGILLLVIANMSYIAKLNKTKVPLEKNKMIAIINEPSMPEKEFKAFSQGIKDGLLFLGLHSNISSVDFNTHFPDTVLTINTDRTLKIIKEQPNCRVIGFNFIDKKSKNYTGIYGGIPWDKNFHLYQKLIPNLKHLGVIYDEKNLDSKRQLEQLSRFIEKNNKTENKNGKIAIYALPTIKTIDEFEKQIETIPPIDALYLVERDKAAIDQLKKIFSLCLENNIPIIGGGFSGPQIGTVASITFSPYKIGRKISKIINTLNKKNLRNNSGIIRQKPELYLNIAIAQRLGIRIPPYIKNQAEKIY
ncbi:MAG: ABC transporter substrate-binding protein [bacterium]